MSAAAITELERAAKQAREGIADEDYYAHGGGPVAEQTPAYMVGYLEGIEYALGVLQGEE